MVTRQSGRAAVTKQSHGGTGKVTMTEILSLAALDGKGSFFSTITIPPGGSVGYHVHKGEVETILVVAGAGETDDGGGAVPFRAGDVLRVADGDGHAIRAVGTQPVELVCLVLYT